MHRAPNDPRVGAVKSHRGDQAQAKADRGAPHGERFVFLEEFREQGCVTLQQPVAEMKELDLLGRAILGQEPGQIIDLPRFGRAPREQPEALFGKARLGDKCRNARRQQNHHQPGAEAQHQRGERDQCDRVLHDLKRVVDQLHRFVAALAAGILQAVVIVGVLEESQVQSQRLANDFGANFIRKLELDELLNQPA